MFWPCTTTALTVFMPWQVPKWTHLWSSVYVSPPPVRMRVPVLTCPRQRLGAYYPSWGVPEMATTSPLAFFESSLRRHQLRGNRDITGSGRGIIVSFSSLWVVLLLLLSSTIVATLYVGVLNLSCLFRWVYAGLRTNFLLRMRCRASLFAGVANVKTRVAVRDRRRVIITPLLACLLSWPSHWNGY